MPVFRTNGALISIGGAVLATIGLSPQRATGVNEARFPAHAVPSGLAYQRTGLGERSITLEARTWPHVVGGLDSLALLNAHYEAQSVVQMIRLKGNFLGQTAGPVVIQTLEVDEERLHPFDGIGRIVDVALTLLKMPRRGGDTSGFDDVVRGLLLR